MKIRNPLCSAALATLVAVGSAWAADVSGKWTAEYQSPDGETRQSTFTFVVKEGQLTGTVSGRRGESAIEEGKLNGDELSFSVTRNWGQGDIRFRYAGKLVGEELKLTVTVGDGLRTFEMTARRVKE
jgi:autotransporter translocation and assembly factor TamB